VQRRGAHADADPRQRSLAAAARQRRRRSTQPAGQRRSSKGLGGAGNGAVLQQPAAGAAEHHLSRHRRTSSPQRLSRHAELSHTSSARHPQRHSRELRTRQSAACLRRRAAPPQQWHPAICGTRARRSGGRRRRPAIATSRRHRALLSCRAAVLAVAGDVRPRTLSWAAGAAWNAGERTRQAGACCGKLHLSLHSAARLAIRCISQSSHCAFIAVAQRACRSTTGTMAGVRS
jgi:hypothetical protein